MHKSREIAHIVLLCIFSFGILTSFGIINYDSRALGQAGSTDSVGNDWESANYSQRLAIAEQESFSKLARELETKITERDRYLSTQLQMASSTSDNAEGESFTSECVIATAAFGSNLAPQVQFLRNFRDGQIKSTAAGSSFMEAFNMWYYSFSPAVAKYERGQPWLQETVRLAITPLLSILQLSEYGYLLLEGESGAIASGVIASSLIGMVYFGPIAFVIFSIKSSAMTRVIFFSLGAVGISLTAIASGIFLEDRGIMMVATSMFVLSVLAVSASFVAKALSVLVGRIWLRIQLFNRRPAGRILEACGIIAVIAIVSSQVFPTALPSSPAFAQQALSTEEIEDQLFRLSEMKSWLEDTRRIESFFPDTIEVQRLTAWVIDVQAQYNGNAGMTDGDFASALQSASDNYQQLSSKVYNDGVADRHFTVKDTLSSAILQLSYSTADEARLKTCSDCDADMANELYSSSMLALETSTQNFHSYSLMLSSDSKTIQSYITEIDLMPNSS